MPTAAPYVWYLSPRQWLVSKEKLPKKAARKKGGVGTASPIVLVLLLVLGSQPAVPLLSSTRQAAGRVLLADGWEYLAPLLPLLQLPTR